MANGNRPLYAVLIDADNIPAKYAGAILKEITSFGEPALRRVYGDWSSGRLGPWTKAVRDLEKKVEKATKELKAKAKKKPAKKKAAKKKAPAKKK